MVAQPIVTMTEEEYLAFERANEAGHEFRDGGVYEMLQITMGHRRIVASSAFRLHDQLHETGCELLMTSMRVKVVATGL